MRLPLPLMQYQLIPSAPSTTVQTAYVHRLSARLTDFGFIHSFLVDLLIQTLLALGAGEKSMVK